MAKKHKITEKIKELLDTLSEKEIDEVGAGFEGMASDEVPLGVCSEGLRRAFTRVRMLIDEARIVVGPGGEEVVEFDDHESNQIFYLLAKLSDKLLVEEFGSEASVRTGWIVVENSPDRRVLN